MTPSPVSLSIQVICWSEICRFACGSARSIFPFRKASASPLASTQIFLSLADQRRIGRNHLAELRVGFSRKKGVRDRTLSPVGRIDAEDLIECRIGELLVIGLRQRIRASVSIGIDLLGLEGNRQLDRGLKKAHPAIAYDGREKDDEETKSEGDRGQPVKLEPDFSPAGGGAEERGIIKAAGGRGSGEIGHGWVIGEDAH